MSTPVRPAVWLALVALAASPAAGGSTGARPRPARASVDARAHVERDAPCASLSVVRGVAKLATQDSVRALTAASSPLDVPGYAFVELGIRSEVAVRWNSLSSATVRGKASFGFETPEAAPLDPTLSILFLHSAELELRRGSLSVDLPEGWNVRLGRAVLAVREAADGGVELVHRGGEPVAIQDLLGPSSGRSAPKRIASGERVLLPRAPRAEHP